MLVFVVLALFAASLNVVLGVYADFLGTAVAYAIVGFLCGLVLRTRLVGGVGRMLVVCFAAIGFPAAGVFTMLTFAAESMTELVFANAFPWALAGFAATVPYLGQERGGLAATMLAVACFGAAGGLAGVLVFETLVELGATELYVQPVLVCLAAGVFDRLCESLGLESPEAGFDRFRVRFEFRWR